MIFAKRSRVLFTRAIIAMCVCIMLLIGIYALYQEEKSYHDHINSGKETAERLVRLLAAYVDSSFVTTELMLRRVTEHYHIKLLLGTMQEEDIERKLSLWIKEVPRIQMLAIANSDGEVIAVSHKKSVKALFKKGQKLKGQGCFTYHTNNNIDGAYISPAVFGGAHYILLSMRMHTVDNNFGGIVLAAIPSQDFIAFLNSIGVGKNPGMIVTLHGSTVLVKDIPKLLDSDLLAGWVRDKMAFPLSNKTEIAVEQSENKGLSIIAFKSSETFPVGVAVMTGEQEILKKWNSERRNYMVFMGLFLGFIILISSFALIAERQLKRITSSEKTAILASQTTEEFMTKMSYEMRTPLNAIIGFSEMMEANYFGQLNDRQKERMHDIFLCSTHLLELVNDIIDFSKGKSGTLALVEKKADLADLVDKALSNIAKQAEEEEINIIKSPSLLDLPPVRIDERKIGQVLFNLLTNSIKFTHPGGHILITGEVTPEGSVNLIIEDSGIGIINDDKSDSLSALRLYYQTRPENRGMSLLLSKVFVELHGGTLDIESHLWEGTRVKIILPAERVLLSEKKFI